MNLPNKKSYVLETLNRVKLNISDFLIGKNRKYPFDKDYNDLLFVIFMTDSKKYKSIIYHLLGKCSRLGYGCKKDVNVAIEYLEKSIKYFPTPECEFELGLLYYNLDKDYESDKCAFDLFYDCTNEISRHADFRVYVLGLKMLLKCYKYEIGTVYNSKKIKHIKNAIACFGN